MRHPNTVLTRQVILDRLWDSRGSLSTTTPCRSTCAGFAKVEDDPDNPVFLHSTRTGLSMECHRMRIVDTVFTNREVKMLFIAVGSLLGVSAAGTGR